MTWTVSILPQADQDLHGLCKTTTQRQDLEEAILSAFAGMKGDRVSKLFRQGVTTAGIDRLAGSAYPGSIRLRIASDHRATVLCLPAYEQAYVTHIFPKSRDPKYVHAVATHDARAGAFIDTFARFLTRKR